MAGLLAAAGRSGWPGGLEADRLADEDDVDAAGQLLVDPEDFPDLAVLPVGGLRAGVFQRQAVLINALMRRCQRRHELLRADDEDDIGGAPGVGGELAACSACSSGSVVNRSETAVVLTATPP
jgi:hypothetical protein